MLSQTCRPFTAAGPEPCADALLHPSDALSPRVCCAAGATTIILEGHATTPRENTSRLDGQVGIATMVDISATILTRDAVGEEVEEEILGATHHPQVEWTRC